MKVYVRHLRRWTFGAFLLMGCTRCAISAEAEAVAQKTAVPPSAVAPVSRDTHVGPHRVGSAELVDNMVIAPNIFTLRCY